MLPPLITTCIEPATSGTDSCRFIDHENPSLGHVGAARDFPTIAQTIWMISHKTTCMSALREQQQTSCGEQHRNPKNGKGAVYSACPAADYPHRVRSNESPNVANGVD